MSRPERNPIQQRATLFMVAGAATAAAGAWLFFGMQPVTDVSDKMWRYPWESTGAFVAFSIFSAMLHAMVALGVVAFGRSGAAGHSRVATAGVAITVAGTVLLLVGELLSIPIRDAQIDHSSVGAVGAVFGVAGTLSMIGFLLLGWATLRAGIWQGWHRYTPGIPGVWLGFLSVLASVFPSLLHLMVGVYGLCLLALAVALYTDPTPGADRDFGELQLQFQGA